MTKCKTTSLILSFIYLVFGASYAQSPIIQPADDSEFYYSVGVGDQQAAAEQNARVNLASRLDSSITTTMKLTYSSMSGLEQSQVFAVDEVSTDSVPLPQSQILESKYHAGVWQALIKISKQQLQQRLSSKLNNLDQNLAQFQIIHKTNNSFSCFADVNIMNKLLQQYIKTSVLAGGDTTQEEGTTAQSIRNIIDRCQNQNHIFLVSTETNDCSEILLPTVKEVIQRFLVIVPDKRPGAGVLKMSCDLQQLQMAGNFLSKITLSLDLFDERAFRQSFPNIEGQAQSFTSAAEADRTALSTLKNKIRQQLEEQWKI